MKENRKEQKKVTFCWIITCKSTTQTKQERVNNKDKFKNTFVDQSQANVTGLHLHIDKLQASPLCVVAN